MTSQRKSGFRQTRLQFKKPDTKQPSSLPSQTPLKPLPRPTAPLVFQKRTPRKKSRAQNSAFEDDYWEMAHRIMDDQTLNPRKRVVEDGAPVIDVDASNSDDDFEPPSVFSQVARQRPQLLTPTSRTRNDRSSMTKSSANRGKKKKKLICITTPSQKRDSSLAVKSKQNTIPVLESSSSEEEVDHVIFEGEKSELSETEEDEPIRPLRREGLKRRAGRRNSSNSYSPGNVKCEDKITDCRKNNAAGPASSPVVKKVVQSNRILFSSQERVNESCESNPDMLLQVSEQCTEAKPAPKRARDLPKLFSEDSDDSVEMGIPRISQRKRARRIRRIEESSEDDHPHIAEEVPVTQNATRLGAEPVHSSDIAEVTSPPALAVESNVHRGQEYELSTCNTEGQKETTQPKRKRLNQSQSLSGETKQPPSRVPIHSDQDFGKSPVREKTRRRLSFVPSQDTGITPPSTPSPPSTRKRRLRSRLITISSDEDGEPCRDQSKQLEAPDKQQKSTGLGRIPEETEWYHEREIGAFSSSGEDSKEGSSPGKVINARSKKRVSARKPGIRSDLQNKLSPIPRDPGLGAAGDFVDLGKLRNHGASRVELRHRMANVNPVSNEIIDLVDNDDFDDIAPNNTHKDAILSSKDDIVGSDVENLKEMPAGYIDDSEPPPFNLYILCNEGESITDMRDRLGENALMDKVLQARNNGRKIIGGDKLGLTTTFDKDIFSRFSKTVVGDQVSRKKVFSVTEKALRGEYNFNYRGRDRDQRLRGNVSRKRGSARPARGKSYKNRLSNLGHRRR